MLDGSSRCGSTGTTGIGLMVEGGHENAFILACRRENVQTTLCIEIVSPL